MLSNYLARQEDRRAALFRLGNLLSEQREYCGNGKQETEEREAWGGGLGRKFVIRPRKIRVTKTLIPSVGILRGSCLRDDCFLKVTDLPLFSESGVNFCRSKEKIHSCCIRVVKVLHRTLWPTFWPSPLIKALLKKSINPAFPLWEHDRKSFKKKKNFCVWKNISTV